MGFRFDYLKPSDPYHSQWADLRRRSFAFWVALVGSIPLMLALAALAHWLLDAEVSFLLVASPILLVILVLYGRRVYWRCPRCGKPFYKTMLMYWPVAESCLHCGLPEYSPQDELSSQ